MSCVRNTLYLTVINHEQQPTKCSECSLFCSVTPSKAVGCVTAQGQAPQLGTAVSARCQSRGVTLQAPVPLGAPPTWSL